MKRCEYFKSIKGVPNALNTVPKAFCQSILTTTSLVRCIFFAGFEKPEKLMELIYFGSSPDVTKQTKLAINLFNFVQLLCAKSNIMKIFDIPRKRLAIITLQNLRALWLRHYRHKNEYATNF
jgi:hypothetical protein